MFSNETEPRQCCRAAEVQYVLEIWTDEQKVNESAGSSSMFLVLGWFLHILVKSFFPFFHHCISDWLKELYKDVFSCLINLFLVCCFMNYMQYEDKWNQVAEKSNVPISLWFRLRKWCVKLSSPPPQSCCGVFLPSVMKGAGVHFKIAKILSPWVELFTMHWKGGKKHSAERCVKLRD